MLHVSIHTAVLDFSNHSISFPAGSNARSIKLSGYALHIDLPIRKAVKGILPTKNETTGLKHGGKLEFWSFDSQNFLGGHQQRLRGDGSFT